MTCPRHSTPGYRFLRHRHVADIDWLTGNHVPAASADESCVWSHECSREYEAN